MIGIIGAMEIETNGLVSKLNDTLVEKVGSYSFVKGNLYGKDVVVCRCGIGKVFSSTAAVLMIEKYGVDCIINLGVAGGAKPLKQGDVVIAERTVQHDYDAVADGLKLGQVHGFNSPYFDCDNTLIEKLSIALNEADVNYTKGVIASGDCFVSSKEKSTAIAKEFGAIAFDMESAAINQVCSVQGVPFCSMRAISDNADDEAVKSFYEFVTEASEKAIDAISKFVSIF